MKGKVILPCMTVKITGDSPTSAINISSTICRFRSAFGEFPGKKFLFLFYS